MTPDPAAHHASGSGAGFGRGDQYWPWISLHDEAAAILHLLDSRSSSGPVNLAGPTPATSDEITEAFAARHASAAPAAGAVDRA